MEFSHGELGLLTKLCQTGADALLKTDDPQWIAGEALSGAFQALQLALEGVEESAIYARALAAQGVVRLPERERI